MNSTGVRPNVITFNALLDCCAKASAVTLAFEIFRHMKKEHISPNRTTYTSLINACCRSDEVDQGFIVIEHMIQGNIAPNVTTYTCLIDSCSKHGMFERAFDTLETMNNRGVRANSATFNALIQSCVRSLRIDLVVAAVLQMSRVHTATPDSVTIKYILQAIDIAMIKALDILTAGNQGSTQV